MNKHFYTVKWGNGVLHLSVSSDLLKVTAANASLVFEPRTVTVRMRYAYRRYVDVSGKRNLYIGFAEKIKPLEASRVDIVGRSYIGSFETIYTDLEFEKYLTIVTPSSFLYNYIVLTTSELMVQMSSKRKIYFEEEPYDSLIAYII